jgi:hypothetical protein
MQPTTNAVIDRRSLFEISDVGIDNPSVTIIQHPTGETRPGKGCRRFAPTFQEGVHPGYVDSGEHGLDTGAWATSAV